MSTTPEELPYAEIRRRATESLVRSLERRSERDAEALWTDVYVSAAVLALVCLGAIVGRLL